MKYTIEYTRKFRTVVEADSEMEATDKVMEKTENKAIITSIKEVNPFVDEPDLLKFFKGFRK